MEVQKHPYKSPSYTTGDSQNKFFSIFLMDSWIEIDEPISGKILRLIA